MYLEFRGVNASAKVELNGALVGTHDGGYSTFRWDVTDLLKAENALTVHAECIRRKQISPSTAVFTGM